MGASGRGLLKSAAPKPSAVDAAPKPTPASAETAEGSSPRAEWRRKLYAAAAKLRDPDYGLKAFHEDMITIFPELNLYLASSAALPDPSALPAARLVAISAHLVTHGTLPADAAVLLGGTAQSADGTAAECAGGRTVLEEYNRTIGALFAVYWLSRLELPDAVPGSAGLDGQRGFCYGVLEDTWQPVDPTAAHAKAEAAKDTAAVELLAKKRKFEASQDWLKLHRLLVDAGVLTQPSADAPATVDVPRMAAMLTLTAIHDLMKNPALLPTVAAKHAPYMGYEAEEPIVDHDIALGYVLTHDPDSLACYASLPEEQRSPIRFTQAKMGFNHGWLVQAEAPPGALFANFKSVLEEGRATAADVAFYFTHWVTDLAGAIPAPLRGAEKFAVAFPAHVLASFVRSFPIVQELAHSTPTQLNERFLVEFWPGGALGAHPTDKGAIAVMRLVTQAQSTLAQSNVYKAFAGLPAEQQATLVREMAYTGRAGEQYELSPNGLVGPAFLVYYSPAFIRQSAVSSEVDAKLALCFLADVYRAARLLFPLGTADADADAGVTIYIDILKGMSDAQAISDSYAAGAVWCLVKTSALASCREAKVERFSQAERLPCCPSETHELLHLWKACFD